MTLIVAMSMEEHFVTQVVVVAVAIKMIDFQNVSIFEMQFTPATFSLLFLKQPRFGLMHQWMRFQTLTPIQQVSIIGTGCSLHFRVPLDSGFAVHSQFSTSRCRKHPLALFHLMPVSLRHPVASFVGMSCSCPMGELFPQDIIASAENC